MVSKNKEMSIHALHPGDTFVSNWFHITILSTFYVCLCIRFCTVV